MSSNNREITFSARDNGVNNVMNQLRQSANQMGRELAKEANEASNSGREAVAYYEQQVRLMEKRNKLGNDASRLQVQSRYEAAGGPGNASDVARQQYQQNMRELSREKKEDQIQIDLLRELIQTIKNTSGQEIRQDRINTIAEITEEDDNNEDLIELSDRLNENSGRGGHRAAGESNTVIVDDDDDSSTSRKGRDGKDLNGVLNASRSVAGASNPVEAGTGAASSLFQSNPILLTLAAITAIGTMGLQRRADRELSASVLAGMSGTSSSAIVDSTLGETNLGQYGPTDLNVSREQYLSNILPAMLRARGTSNYADEKSMQGIELERGLGLSSGSAVSLEKLARVMEGNTDAQKLTNKIYSAYYGTGALGGSNIDMSRMQDMMQGFVGFREQQFMSSGSTNANSTLGMMRMLQKLGGNFQRDDYAFDTMSRLNSGLQGGTAEAQGIKFGLLRQLNPNMDYFDLKTEMSKGTDSPGYLASVLKMVKSRGGTESQQKIWLDALLGGSMRGQDISSLINGDVNPNDIDKQATQRSVNYRERAVNASSKAKADLDFGAETMNDMMSGLGKRVVELLELIAKALN